MTDTQYFKRIPNSQHGWDSRDPDFDIELEFLETKGDHFFLDLINNKISIKNGETKE